MHSLVSTFYEATRIVCRLKIFVYMHNTKYRVSVFKCVKCYLSNTHTEKIFDVCTVVHLRGNILLYIYTNEINKCIYISLSHCHNLIFSSNYLADTHYHTITYTRYPLPANHYPLPATHYMKVSTR